MAKTGITYEQVARTCQTMLKEGQTITARGIMAKTGGSPNLIVKHWQQWRREQEDIALVAMGEELSPQIKQAILAECARKTTAVKQQLAGQVATAEQHLTEIQELLQQAALEKDTLATAANKANQQIIEQDKRQAVTEQRLLDIEQRNKEIEQLYRESSLAHERVNTEKTMIEKQKESLEKRIDYLERQLQELQNSKHQSELAAAAFKASHSKEEPSQKISS